MTTSRARMAAAISGVLGAAVLASAQAAPVIGFDPDGAGATYGFLYADLFSNRNDTVLTIPTSAPSGPNPPPFNVGDTAQFQTQLQVDSLSFDNDNVEVPGLNTVFELTKEIVGAEQTAFFNGTPGQVDSSIRSTFLADDFNNITIYYDLLADGSVNIPTGTGSADCYGSGSCGDGTGDGDGTVILEGNLVDFSATFLQTGGTPTAPAGQGGFDLLFEITYYDPDYLDVSNLEVNGGTGLPLFGERITGSLIQPLSLFNPGQMWNGESTTQPGAQLFVADSSQTFVATVPAPATLLLLGPALIGLGLVRGRRKQAA